MALLHGKRLAAAIALAGGLVLGGCAYDDGYGYGGVSVGYGAGSYYGYDDYYYPRYGYPAYGWYDGFYYPGTGYYIFDRDGRRHRWNDHHRRHWQDRSDRAGRWEGRGRSDRGWLGRRDQADRGDGQPGRTWRERRDRGEASTPRPQRATPEGRGFRSAPDRERPRERGGWLGN